MRNQCRKGQSCLRVTAARLSRITYKPNALNAPPPHPPFHPLPLIAMESERTRIYIVYGGYDKGYNFETSDWIMQEPNTYLYFRKDMRVANTLFSSVLYKHRKAVIKLFKKEVDLCGCHLRYIDHRLVMDTGWEYPEDTGKLVFIVSYVLV